MHGQETFDPIHAGMRCKAHMLQDAWRLFRPPVHALPVSKVTYVGNLRRSLLAVMISKSFILLIR